LAAPRRDFNLPQAVNESIDPIRSEHLMNQRLIDDN